MGVPACLIIVTIASIIIFGVCYGFAFKHFKGAFKASQKQRRPNRKDPESQPDEPDPEPINDDKARGKVSIINVNISSPSLIDEGTASTMTPVLDERLSTAIITTETESPGTISKKSESKSFTSAIDYLGSVRRSITSPGSITSSFGSTTTNYASSCDAESNEEDEQSSTISAASTVSLKSSPVYPFNKKKIDDSHIEKVKPI